MGDSEALTDLGNVRRLVAHHGDDLRFVSAWSTWLCWDGRRWARDETGEVMRRAKATARALTHEAVELPESRAREEHLRHALRSEQHRALVAMVELAKTEPGISARVTDLDSDPWVLNVQNGTLDLRTLELRPHQREDGLTRCCAVPFDADACDDTFARFVERILPDAETQYFVQRALGYSLLGVPREEVLFFVHGPPASGKSTLLEGVKRALGDYATTADFETFLQRRDGGPRPDIARLAGVRFVASVEVDDGKRLAAGLVKTLTGGDTVTARFLYGRDFEFRPAFKLWLAANDEPRVSDADDALWRRILEVPFAESIPEAERDPAVKAALTDPEQCGAALLAWMVAGLREYLADGLRPPAAVRRATDAYRARMDPLTEWWDERIEVAPEASATVGELFASYLAWAEGAGVRKPMSPKSFGQRLTKRGFGAQPDAAHTRIGIRPRCTR